MIEENNTIALIILISLFGILFATYNIICLYLINPTPILDNHSKDNEEAKFIQNSEIIILSKEKIDKMIYISDLISDGANVFLAWEYLCLLIFVLCISILIFFTAEHKFGNAYTTIAFAIGSITSIICGFIGMKIATAANYRTAYKSHFGLGEAFGVAYQGGCVLGFILVSLTILVLMSLVIIYKAMLVSNDDQESYIIMYEAITGFGLGGSSVALFCRVGGGIFTKAADVGADLVAKLEMNLEEDDPKNPACIADNVGDNVGDIAGMGSDLFGSLAESTCAALLIGATSKELIKNGSLNYPIILTSIGILVSILTVLIAIFTLDKIDNYEKLEITIKNQIIISTLLMIPCIILISMKFLPSSYNIGYINTITYRANVTKFKTMVCPILGLISGMLIGIITEYYTSMNNSPVKKLVQGCKRGASENLILGLALGYMSTLLPTLLIFITVYFSFKFCVMYGISLAAIGMLGNLPVCLAIDGYGPISDNAGGIATMCQLDSRIREITDDLDSAGNTTAAIGKGFAIGSACLVALALFGAFVTRTKIDDVDLLTPIIFSGLLFGAMIPYLFSALTMKAVGLAAEDMVQAVRDEFIANKDRYHDKTYQPDTNKCIRIATNSSLTQMILPGTLVIFIPIIFGILLGPKSVAGLLIGIIISGIQMATSMANSGGAWDNTKKCIKKRGISVNQFEKIKYKITELRDLKSNEKVVSDEEINHLENQLVELKTREFDECDDFLKEMKGEKMKIYKRSEKASIIGDTVGDPMKDTSGPSLNILIKLSSITSVVFASLFVKTSLLIN